MRRNKAIGDQDLTDVEIKVPDVTILIPAYNESDSIQKAVLSVTQDQPGILTEVLVLDDASTDATVAKAEEAGATVFSVKKNIGKGAILNKFMAQAKGRYLLVLDADDYIAPNALTLLVSQVDDYALAAQDNAFFAYGSTQYHGGSNIRHIPAIVPTQKYFTTNPVCSVILVPTEAVLNAGVKFSTDIYVFEDWLFIAALVKKKFRPLPFPEILVLHYQFDTAGRYKFLIENNAQQRTLEAIRGL